MGYTIEIEPYDGAKVRLIIDISTLSPCGSKIQPFAYRPPPSLF